MVAHQPAAARVHFSVQKGGVFGLRHSAETGGNSGLPRFIP